MDSLFDKKPWELNIPPLFKNEVCEFYNDKWANKYLCEIKFHTKYIILMARKENEDSFNRVLICRKSNEIIEDFKTAEDFLSKMDMREMIEKGYLERNKL